MLKGIVLALLLVVLLVFYSRVVQNGVPEQFGGLFDTSYDDGRHLEQFERPVRDAYKKKYAGFWHAEEMLSDAIRLKDRLELKDNGIIWQVLHYQMRLPGGDSTSFTHVRHAYLDPYGRDTRDTTEVVGEMHIIGQVYYASDDTCYGPSGENLLWKVGRTQEGLRFHGRDYASYETASLDTFFPAGAIKLIDNINVPKCPEKTGLRSFLHLRLARAFQKMNPSANPEDKVKELLHQYYAPIILDPMVEYYRTWKVQIPQQISLELVIGADGNVIRTSIKGQTVQGRKAEEAIAEEAKVWKFPPIQDSAAPVSITYTYKVPPPR